MRLTEKEKNKFFNEGFLLKNDIFKNNEFDLLKFEINSIIQDICNNYSKNYVFENDFSELSFEERLSSIYKSYPYLGKEIVESISHGKFNESSILQAIRHKKLVDCIANLIGNDIVASSIYRVRPKLPSFSGGEIPLHQDAGYQNSNCDKLLSITCWIPIVNVNVNNGCLWVAPKAHKKGIFKHIFDRNNCYLEIPRNMFKFNLIPVEMNAGSVLFMTNLTPHASFRNSSNITRWSIDLRYQDFNIPNNINQKPKDFINIKNENNLPCSPNEAYFVVKDSKFSSRELKDANAFKNLRMLWENEMKDLDKPSNRWN